MGFFWRSSPTNGSSVVGKERLKNILSTERSISLAYIDDLKRDIRILVLKHAKSSEVMISADIDKNRNVDIMVSISETSK